MRSLVFYLCLYGTLLIDSNAITHNESAMTVCYFSNWAISRPGIGKYTLDDIPGGVCSHIIYAFVGFSVTNASKITELKPEDDTNPNGISKFSKLRTRLPQAKLLASVGGWGIDTKLFPNMISKADSRRLFVDSVISFLKAFNLDGINFSWFWPGHEVRGGTPEDKANFALLLKELSEAFDNNNLDKEITVTAPVEEFRLEEGYAVADICRYADYIYLTTYDLRGSWNNFADVHTPMGARSFEQDYFKKFNVASGVTMWQKKGCPPGKLVLGVSTHGRTYTLQNTHDSSLGAPTKGSGQLGEFTNVDGYIAYYEICQRIKEGWTVHRDSVGNVPYITKADQWVGYDDQESLKEKIKITKEKGLAGIMIFALDMDDFRGVCGQRYPLTLFLSSEMRKIPSVNSFDFSFAFDRLD